VDANDKGVTAAVTRYGYWRVESFEGCEPRAEEGTCGPDDSVIRSGDPVNGANPMIGSGTQQARNPPEEKAVEREQDPVDGT
jgi:hypothetical protein